MKKYSIEDTNPNAHYDCHLDDSDDLKEAKEMARFWTSKGYNVDLVLSEEFETGNYNPIEF